jgi:hypothetical protein
MSDLYKSFGEYRTDIAAQIEDLGFTISQRVTKDDFRQNML